MKREMILPVLLSFGISLALGPVLIPVSYTHLTLPTIA